MSYTKNSMPTKGGMSFILAQTAMFQLQMLEGSLLGRINHISLMYSEVRAIIDGKEDMKVAKEDILKLEEVAANIDALRRNYEPFLDDPEARQTVDTKRKLSEKLIDLSRYNLLYTMEKYKLVDVRALQEITGLTWSDS